MFEVGKKYHRLHTPNQPTYTCLWVEGSFAVLKGDGCPFISTEKRFKYFKEYVEPKKLTRYINLYPSGFNASHSSRALADEYAHSSRIACKRIEVTEGEYDE